MFEVKGKVFEAKDFLKAGNLSIYGKEKIKQLEKKDIDVLRKGVLSNIEGMKFGSLISSSNMADTSAIVDKANTPNDISYQILIEPCLAVAGDFLLNTAMGALANTAAAFLAPTQDKVEKSGKLSKDAAKVSGSIQKGVKETNKTITSATKVMVDKEGKAKGKVIVAGNSVKVAGGALHLASDSSMNVVTPIHNVVAQASQEQVGFKTGIHDLSVNITNQSYRESEVDHKVTSYSHQVAMESNRSYSKDIQSVATESHETQGKSNRIFADEVMQQSSAGNFIASANTDMIHQSGDMYMMASNGNSNSSGDVHALGEATQYSKANDERTGCVYVIANGNSSKGGSVRLVGNNDIISTAGRQMINLSDSSVSISKGTNQQSSKNQIITSTGNFVAVSKSMAYVGTEKSGMMSYKGKTFMGRIPAPIPILEVRNIELPNDIEIPAPPSLPGRFTNETLQSCIDSIVKPEEALVQEYPDFPVDAYPDFPVDAYPDYPVDAYPDFPVDAYPVGNTVDYPRGMYPELPPQAGAIITNDIPFSTAPIVKKGKKRTNSPTSKKPTSNTGAKNASASRKNPRSVKKNTRPIAITKGSNNSISIVKDKKGLPIGRTPSATESTLNIPQSVSGNGSSISNSATAPNTLIGVSSIHGTYDTFSDRFGTINNGILREDFDGGDNVDPDHDSRIDPKDIFRNILLKIKVDDIRDLGKDLDVPKLTVEEIIKARLLLPYFNFVTFNNLSLKGIRADLIKVFPSIKDKEIESVYKILQLPDSQEIIEAILTRANYAGAVGFLAALGGLGSLTSLLSGFNPTSLALNLGSSLLKDIALKVILPKISTNNLFDLGELSLKTLPFGKTPNFNPISNTERLLTKGDLDDESIFSIFLTNHIKSKLANGPKLGEEVTTGIINFVSSIKAGDDIKEDYILNSLISLLPPSLTDKYNTAVTLYNNIKDSVEAISKGDIKDLLRNRTITEALDLISGSTNSSLLGSVFGKISNIVGLSEDVLLTKDSIDVLVDTVKTVPTLLNMMDKMNIDSLDQAQTLLGCLDLLDKVKEVLSNINSVIKRVKSITPKKSSKNNNNNTDSSDINYNEYTEDNTNTIDIDSIDVTDGYDYVFKSPDEQSIINSEDTSAIFDEDINTLSIIEELPRLVEIVRSVQETSEEDIEALNVEDYIKDALREIKTIDIDILLDSCYKVPQLNYLEAQVVIEDSIRDTIIFSIPNLELLKHIKQIIPGEGNIINVKVEMFETESGFIHRLYKSNIYYAPNIYKYVINDFNATSNIGTASIVHSESSIILENSLGELYEHDSNSIGVDIFPVIQESYLVI